MVIQLEVVLQIELLLVLEVFIQHLKMVIQSIIQDLEVVQGSLQVLFLLHHHLRKYQ
jgi:hypothetical protein